MKKIGILSQYYRRNYGGILQSYALFRTVQELGYDVEIVDFRYDAKENFSFLQILKLLKNKFWGSSKPNGVHKTIIRKLPSEHVEAFMNFKKEFLKLSPVLSNKTIGEYVSKYDAIIVGSDQVWNDLEGRHLYYFFDFGKPYYGKKITYAPCSIITNISKRTKKRLKKQLMAIDALSVRDKTTQNLVTMSSGLNPEIVLDPTCLYDFKEFISNPIIDGDYIFTYILGSEIDCGHNAVLEKIFEKYGKMKIIAAIVPDDSLEVEKFADEVKYNASPAHWVNLIANAKFVYTDSFHGCVFSMKYHKPFFAYYRDAKRSSRLVDLSKTYSLPNIQSSNSDIHICDIDYEVVDNILALQKNNSLNYIKKNLP